MRTNGQFKIIETTQKYKNPWIEVNEDKIIKPDGKSGIFGFIIMKAGVSVLAIDEKNNAYLVEEFKYALRQNSIEAVSGGIDNNETALQTAKRELQEELGIIAEEWIDLGLVNPFTSVINSPAYLFVARQLSFTRNNPEPTEIIRQIKIPLQEAVNMVLESKITHAQSAVLILKANNYFKNKN